MDRYLVTGGAGFVAGETVRRLLSLGKQVTVLDRQPPTGMDCPFVSADIADPDSLAEALGGMRFDCLMHFASLPGDTGDPQQMMRTNVNGCLNLLEFARAGGAKSAVVASSISAYEWYPATKFSPPRYMPVDEEHPCRPRDMYSTTKRMQELLVQTYYHEYGLNACALRFAAVIGPGGRGGGAGWGEIARQLKLGGAVEIPHLTADELCHYVDIRDIARMFEVCAGHPAAAGQIFNCCGPKPVRGREMAEAFLKVSPGIEVLYGYPWSMAQGGEVAFSMEKAERLLGFEPIYTIEQSIASLLD